MKHVEAKEVARAILQRAFARGYLDEDESLLVAETLAEAEKQTFLVMFQALQQYLSKAERDQLDENEIASLFNYCVGKASEHAYNYLAGQKLAFEPEGMFTGRISLYVDERMIDMLKSLSLASDMAECFLDYRESLLREKQSEGEGEGDPLLILFEALKWTYRIATHLALVLMEDWTFPKRS